MLIITALVLGFGIYSLIENQKITQKLKAFEKENFRSNKNIKKKTDNSKQE